MSKVKVYMTESWYTYRRSHTIEIDTDDYKELKGMTDEEAYDYLSENMWDFEMKKEDGAKYSSTLSEELQEDWIREKTHSEETDLYKQIEKSDYDNILFSNKNLFKILKQNKDIYQINRKHQGYQWYLSYKKSLKTI